MYYKTKNGWANPTERKSLGVSSRFGSTYTYASNPGMGWIAPLADGTYASMYRNDLNVFAAVNKLANYTAHLPLKTYQLGDNGDRIRVRDHALAVLLDRPYVGGSTRSLIDALVRTVAIHGKAHAALLRPREGAAPNQIVPIIPGSLKATVAKGEVIAYQWQRTKDAEATILSPDDVLCFELWGGVSPLEPLKKTLELEDRAQRYAISNFDNAARPSGILTIDEDLDEEDLAGIRAQLNARHGGPDNAFKVAVLNASAKWEPFSHTAQEAELIAHRQLAVEAVARVYDIPAPLLNDLLRATYSNIETLERSFYKGTLAPWVSMIESVLTAQLIDKVAAFAGVFIEFDQNAVLQGSITERAAAYMQFAQAGIYTHNELRKLENLPISSDPRADIPGGLLPNAQAPTGSLPNPQVDSTGTGN